MTAPSRDTAYRYIHASLNCRDVDALSAFYADVFEGKEIMRIGGRAAAPVDGRLLGTDRECWTTAAFVYDHRGPRSACAMELIEWHQPATDGTPYVDPCQLGLQAIGFSVPDLAATAQRALGHGATVSAWTETPRLFDVDAITLVDPSGIQVDIVAEVDASSCTLRHVRQNVRDLSASVAFYREIGLIETAPRRTLRLCDRPVEVAELTTDDDQHRLLLVGGLAGHDDRPYPTAHHAGIFRSALAVEHAGRAQERLAAGGQSDGTLTELRLPGTGFDRLSILVLTDPDGVMVELVERDRSTFRD